MKVLRIITGGLLLASSLVGDATGKAGRVICKTGEVGSWAGKHATKFVGDTACGIAESWTQNGWAASNDVAQFTTDSVYAVGYLNRSTSNLLKGTEKVSKGGGKAFTKVEQYSQTKTAQALDLMDAQKNEYRDLDLDFAWRGSRVKSQIDQEDWVLVNEFPTPTQLSKSQR